MKGLHQFILAAASTVAVFAQSQDPAVKAKTQPTPSKPAAKSPAPAPKTTVKRARKIVKDDAEKKD